jgi:hypothetical protein
MRRALPGKGLVRGPGGGTGCSSLHTCAHAVEGALRLWNTTGGLQRTLRAVQGLRCAARSSLPAAAAAARPGGCGRGQTVWQRLHGILHEAPCCAATDVLAAKGGCSHARTCMPQGGVAATGEIAARGWLTVQQACSDRQTREDVNRACHSGHECRGALPCLVEGAAVQIPSLLHVGQAPHGGQHVIWQSRPVHIAGESNVLTSGEAWCFDVAVQTRVGTQPATSSGPWRDAELGTMTCLAKKFTASAPVNLPSPSSSAV